MGRPEALTPLREESRFHRLVTWDIETVKETMVPFLCGIRWGEKPDDKIQFQGPDCIAKTLDWFLDDSQAFPDTHYYAHNGGGFDHQFLIYEAIIRRPGQFRLMPVLSGGSTILVFVRRKDDGQEFILYDSLRMFIAQSLASIGEKMGVSKKGSMDLDAPTNDPRWLEYNDRDTLVLWQALDRLQTAIIELGGEMRATAASTAMDLFRRRFLKHPIAQYRNTRNISREVYVGGRTEVFDLRRRTGKINYYDVNSLYPFACLNPLPVELVEVGRKSTDGLPKCGPNETLFANCLVEVPESCSVPPLPVRHNHKLVFPVGRFWGWWASPDLTNLLLAGGSVVRTSRFYRWRTEPIAREMMTELYKLRQTSSRPEMVVAAKGLMNSFYGKFGQKVERRVCVFNPDVGDMDEGSWTLADEDRNYWAGEQEKEQDHILPHIAAMVTSLARGIHYPLLLSCKDPIYCDTDSIICTDTLPTGPGLGQLKLEHTFESFQALAPKTYAAKTDDGKLVEHAKGFGGWNKQNYENGLVDHLKQGGSVRVQGPMKMLSLVASGDMQPREKRGKDGKLGNVKQLRGTFDKRIVNDDGTTRPLVLKEG